MRIGWQPALGLLLTLVSQVCLGAFTNSSTGGLVTSTISAAQSSLITSLSSLSNRYAAYEAPSIAFYISRDYFGVEPSLASSCINSELQQYRANLSAYISYYGVPPPVTTTYTHGYTSGGELITGTIPFIYKRIEQVHSSPCCGGCTAWGRNAKLIYWPTPNPFPNVTKVVDSTGFTYTSPSVYVRYGGLQASNKCGPVGTELSLTTLAFQPSELSTLRKTFGMDANAGTYELDFRDLGTNCIGDAHPSKTSTAPDGVVGVWGPCQAILAIPSKVLDLYPEWSTCAPGPGETGIHDPPFVLTPGGDLGAVTANSPVTQPPAQPSAVPDFQPARTTPPVVRHTSAASMDPGIPPANPLPSDPPPNNSPVINPPANNPPANNPPANTPPANNPPANNPPANNPPANNPSANNSPTVNSPPKDPSEVTSPTNNAPADAPAINPPAKAPSTSDSPANSPAHGLPQPTESSDSAASNTALAKIPPSNNPPTNDLPPKGTPLISSPTTNDSPANNPFPDSDPIQSTPSGSGQKTSGPVTAIVFGGITASPVPSAVAIGSQTIAVGQPAVTVAGTLVSLGLAGLVVATQTINPSPGSPVVVGSATASTLPPQLIIGGQTITQGQPPILIAGTPVSLGSAALVIASHTIAVPPVVTAPFVLNGLTASIVPSGAVINGQTVQLGRSAITISGNLVSIGAAGFIVGSSTIPLTQFPVPAIATVAGLPIIPTGSDGAVAVAGTTLSRGSPAITVSGTPISLNPIGALVIGLSTLPPSPTPTAVVFTIGSNTFTVDATKLTIGSMVLTPGSPPVTIGGTLVSLGNTALVVGTRTETFGGIQETGVPGGLGGIILSGLGQVGGGSVVTTAVNGTIVPFLGSGRKIGVSGFGTLITISITILVGWG